MEPMDHRPWTKLFRHMSCFRVGVTIILLQMKFLFFLFALTFGFLHTGYAAPPLTEAQKIDRLIAYVKNLEVAVFIRNGSEHTTAEAAAHMQMKREKGAKYARTADDFIHNLASKSSFSGKPYFIRFKDGRTVSAAEVLRKELQRLEAQK
jgi:hypothetical protein